MSIVAYFLLGMYYSSGFPCFTWINGVYCTGKSVEELNSELVAAYKYDGLKVIDAEGNELKIKPSDVNCKVDYTKSLYGFLEKNNPYAWGLYVFKNLVVEYEPERSYDHEKLREIVAGWKIFDVKETKDVSIAFEDGYILRDDAKNIPNPDNIYNVVATAFDLEDDEVNIGEIEGCYKVPEYSEEDLELIEIFNKVDDIQSREMTFEVMGSEVKLDKKTIADWIVTGQELQEILDETAESTDGSENSDDSKKSKDIVSVLYIAGDREFTDLTEEELFNQGGFLFDENGYLILNESKMLDYAEEFSEKYDTSWCMENYKNGLSNTIYLNNNPKKGYAPLVDKDLVFNSIKETFNSASYEKADAVEIATVDKLTTIDASEKLGKTFIEVDMGEQHLYYYVDGKLSMDMPIVTGNVNRGRSTPTGVFNIYNKRYHTYLRGVDYVSYVNYWLGVNKGVGIHDANWRSEFGGDIYKRDGSHGCINCPEEKVSKLWEVAEVGTPVILYY